MGYQVVDGVVQYPPLSAENRAAVISLVKLFDKGQGVTIADLRRVAPLPRLELWNALQTLTAEGALSRTVRKVNGGSFEYFSVGVDNG